MLTVMSLRTYRTIGCAVRRGTSGAGDGRGRARVVEDRRETCVCVVRWWAGGVLVVGTTIGRRDDDGEQR